MDVTLPSYLDQRAQQKREEYKYIIRALVEGIASLVDGQKCFADEFGLSYGRVFHDEYELFKGQDTQRIIADWLRSGEQGAALFRNLFHDMAQHQLALIEAADEVAVTAMEVKNGKKDKLSTLIGKDNGQNAELVKSLRSSRQMLHQYLVAPAFVAGYAKSRESLGTQGSEKKFKIVQGKFVHDDDR